MSQNCFPIFFFTRFSSANQRHHIISILSCYTLKQNLWFAEPNPIHKKRFPIVIFYARQARARGREVIRLYHDRQAGRPVAVFMGLLKSWTLSRVKDIRRSFTHENVFTRRSFTCMWKIFVQDSQRPVKNEARIHLLLHKIRWGFTLAKIKYVKDSSCSDFGDIKIRRRVDVECLTTLEGGRFKIPVDGCINWALRIPNR